MNCADELIRKIIMSCGAVNENALRIIMNEYEISHKSTELAIPEDGRQKAVQMFIVTKKVEGCSDKTIAYYIGVLKRFFTEINSNIDKITADQVRYYIAIRSERDKLSKVSQDNELRVLKSFFSWCSAEDYITKNPTTNIKAIKQEKRIKKPFSEVELERLRKAAESKRDIAILETLYSTGCRASELCGMNRSEVDGDEIIVFGKGGKERICYLNAKARLALSDYLSERSDDNPALFVNAQKPFNRLSRSSIEKIVREIGQQAGVENCHPHRFRRTAATIALNRGMPIDQVQQMLGHARIATTTIYAQSEAESVKASHRKFVV
ncbi:MAG: tyrosine-type recombinase/integrase [Oscillospiraceae bacterium]|nr:tyrosine-type recombinase/integrase [Oscillospiraceae bacterium]